MALPVKLINFCLEKVRSFSEYLPYLTYDEESEVYILIDGTRGFIFDCIPLPMASSETAEVLNGLFSMYFPPGSSINFNLIGLPVSELTWNKVRSGRVRFKHLIEKRLEFLKRSLDKLAISEKFPIPVRDVFLLVSVRLSSQFERLQNIKRAVKQILEYAGLCPQELKPEGLINILYRVFNPNHYV